MGEIRDHKGRLAEKYVTDRPNQPLTIEEISNAIDWPMGSVSTRLGKMVRMFPGRMVRIRRGLYEWRPEGAPTDVAAAAEPTEFLVSVVHRKDGKVLVRDEYTDALYLLTPFEF